MKALLLDKAASRSKASTDRETSKGGRESKGRRSGSKTLFRTLTDEQVPGSVRIRKGLRVWDQMGKEHKLSALSVKLL